MKNNIIVSIIALLLVAAAIVGMVALYRNVDSAFDTDKTDETSSGSETSGSTSNTEKPSPETTKPSSDYVSDDFYIDEVNQTGYRTIGNITYFFKVIKPVYNPTYQDYNCCVYIKENGLNSYASYEVIPEYSHDSLLWENFSHRIEPNVSDFDFQEFILSDDGVMYISYTHIANCTDRAYVLSDLNANVFSNSSLFKYEVIWAAG